MPLITITGPTAALSYEIGTSTLTTRAGTASDTVGVASVTWSCATCSPTSGSATGTSSWSVISIGLATGLNTIMVEACDAAANCGQGTIGVTFVTTSEQQFRLPWRREAWLGSRRRGLVIIGER